MKSLYIVHKYYDPENRRIILLRLISNQLNFIFKYIFLPLYGDFCFWYYREYGLEYIEGIKSISFIYGISPGGIKYLSKCKKIELICCFELHVNDYQYFCNVNEFIINNCLERLKYLKNVKSIIIIKRKSLIDKGLENLKNMQQIKYIKLEECRSITDEGLKYLKNIPNIELKKCLKITEKGIQFLKDNGCKILM